MERGSTSGLLMTAPACGVGGSWRERGSEGTLKEEEEEEEEGMLVLAFEEEPQG